MNAKRNRLVVCLMLAVCAPAWASPKIGDKAPAVKIAKWMTDRPAALPGEAGSEKHVFLVEFWATWCRPCLRSIPHLGELQKRHEQDGLVVIGVSNEEAATIRQFIKKKMKMEYHVGQDDEMETNNEWCDDIEEIPFAFLVDKSGTVVWRGNPLGDSDVMDTAIREVLAGKYDLEAAKLVAVSEEKYRELFAELQAAQLEGKRERIPEIADEMIRLRPGELMPYQIKRMYLLEKGKTEELQALEAKMEKRLKDSPRALFELVSIELGKDLATRSPGLMLRCAERVNKLKQRRDPDALSLLARVQCEMGLVDEAIESQRQAAALAPEEAREYHRRLLKYYRSVEEAARAHRLAAAGEAEDSE